MKWSAWEADHIALRAYKRAVERGCYQFMMRVIQVLLPLFAAGFESNLDPFLLDETNPLWFILDNINKCLISDVELGLECSEHCKINYQACLVECDQDELDCQFYCDVKVAECVAPCPCYKESGSA